MLNVDSNVRTAVLFSQNEEYNQYIYIIACPYVTLVLSLSFYVWKYLEYYWYKYIQYRSRKQRLSSICIFFPSTARCHDDIALPDMVLTDVYIQGKKQKKRRRKQEGKDYFGISLYRQEDIAVVVLFANNLGRGDIYTYIFYIII